jgi:hypothetical protein
MDAAPPPMPTGGWGRFCLSAFAAKFHTGPLFFVNNCPCQVLGVTHSVS